MGVVVLVGRGACRVGLGDADGETRDRTGETGFDGGRPEIQGGRVLVVMNARSYRFMATCPGCGEHFTGPSAAAAASKLLEHAMQTYCAILSNRDCLDATQETVPESKADSIFQSENQEYLFHEQQARKTA